MKTIFTLLLASIVSTAFARDEGRLSISVVSSKSLQVYIDGRQYRLEEGALTLNNVQPGNHRIQVYRAADGYYGNSNSNGRSRNNDRRGEAIYSSTIYLRPSYHLDVTINRFGKALVDERALSNRGWEDDEDNWNGNYNGGGYGNGYTRAMSNSDFDNLLQRIRGQWFGRLGTTRDAISENYFTTAQLRQILVLFSAESEKLDLAKLGLYRLTDRQNFRQLYDLFSYSSQIELDRYQRENR